MRFERIVCATEPALFQHPACKNTAAVAAAVPLEASGGKGGAKPQGREEPILRAAALEVSIPPDIPVK